MSYYLELASITDVEKLKTDWVELEAASDCSYFQSWGWIGTWLVEVGNDLNPEVIRVWDRDKLVAIGIFVEFTVRRAGILTSKKLFLNEAPVENRNMVIEYNGLLVKRGHEESVYRAVIYHLRYASKGWDELYLGMLKKNVAETFTHQLGEEFYLTIEKQSKSWQFDSRDLENGIEAICATFSRNRRYQVNKSFKAYESEGEIKIQEAKNIEQALEFFDGLKELHTARWVAKGKTGSFSNQLWEDFHRKLISTRYSNNEIQLLKILTPKSTIGYIYNFLWRDRVYVLQTGFNMDIPKGGQPGYVSHINAILHNQNKGYSLYDLLSEDTGYKRILCNRTEELVTVSLKRIAMKSMLRQLSPSCVKNGYINKVIRTTLADKYNTYHAESFDYLQEIWLRWFKKWPSNKKKYLLVGAESSGTTAVSDLLFKGVKNIRYLEEGEQQWVWQAYRNIYQKKQTIRDFPRLQLFDAIKVPGFSVIINEFLTCFPNTTVVYLVRDPRDFASSAIKTWKIGNMQDFDKVPWSNIDWLGIDCNDPVECLALRWKAYINAASKIKDVVFVRYEDFCQDKVGVISELCRNLQLPFDEDRVAQLCDVQLSHMSVRAYRPAGPGGWRESILEPEHIRRIENICHEEMQHWGYDMASSEDFHLTG